MQKEPIASAKYTKYRLASKSQSYSHTFSQPIMVVNKRKKPDDENYGLVSLLNKLLLL